MDDLKLMAVDEEDLGILSAHCQDAVVRGADVTYRIGERRFVLVLNRFVWEKETARRRSPFRSRAEHERRRSVLHFDRVTAVSSRGLSKDDPDAVLALLAVLFHPADAPSGTVELVFAGGAAIRLSVECIEAQLADVGGAWSTPSRPDHERDDDLRGRD